MTTPLGSEHHPDDAPYVCPGCYAVGGEPCLPGCIDDEMAREHLERFDDDDLNDCQDWEIEP